MSPAAASDPVIRKKSRRSVIGAFRDLGEEQVTGESTLSEPGIQPLDNRVPIIKIPEAVQEMCRCAGHVDMLGHRIGKDQNATTFIGSELMNPEELDLFHRSLNRCTANEEFLERFYDLFMRSSPEVRERFARTNWLRQKRMLVASFHMMLVAEEKGTDGNAHLERLAATHSKQGRNITPDLYDLWLDCLLRAARDFDPEWNEKIEAVWRKTMTKGIRYMTSRYNRAATTGTELP